MTFAGGFWFVLGGITAGVVFAGFWLLLAIVLGAGHYYYKRQKTKNSTPG